MVYQYQKVRKVQKGLRDTYEEDGPRSRSFDTIVNVRRAAYAYMMRNGEVFRKEGRYVTIYKDGKPVDMLRHTGNAILSVDHSKRVNGTGRLIDHTP